MKLIVSERMRKIMGVGTLVSMIAGACPPLMGTTAGVTLLVISGGLWFPFFATTFISNDLMVSVFGIATIAGIALLVIGIPALLFHAAAICETGQAASFVFMAALIYGGLMYFLMRILHKRSSR